MKRKRFISLSILVPVFTSLFTGFQVMSTEFVKAQTQDTNVSTAKDEVKTTTAAGDNKTSITVSAPSNLKVPTQAFNENSITLIWNKPDNYSNIVDYNVYMNGKLLGDANKNNASPAKQYFDNFYKDTSNSDAEKISMHSYIATGLKPNTSYTFTVRAVDAAGKESADSNSVTQATTDIPAIFDVTKYGAAGDGVTLDTKAIQDAIDACTPNAKVLVPQGKTFKTGPITLKSDMIFEVDGTLLGSDNADDYPYPDPTHKSVTKTTALITAGKDKPGTKNIKVVGTGTIDGNGWKHAEIDKNDDGFPNYIASNNKNVLNDGILAAAQVKKAVDSFGFTQAEGYSTRSNLIEMKGVTNLYYGDGISLINPSQHTVSNGNCTNVVANGLSIHTYDCNNGDGIGLAGGSGLTIVNSIIDTGDDSVGFNAGGGAASEKNPPVSDIWVYNNYFGRGHGAIVGGSYTGSWIQNILAEDNVMNGEGAGLRFKTNAQNGGGARNVVFRDNALKNITDGAFGQAFIFTSEYSDANAIATFEPAKNLPQFKDIFVKNCTIDNAKRNAIFVCGLPAAYHEGIHFENVAFKDTPPTNISYMKNSTFTNVTFDNTDKDPWVIKNSTGLTFDGSTTMTDGSKDAAAAPAWDKDSELTAASVDDTSVTLNWSGASDNTNVAAYKIFKDNRLIATADGNVNTYTVTGLSPALSYKLKIEAADATGNCTSTGPSVEFTTTGTGDTTAPVEPEDNSVKAPAKGIGTTWLTLQWNPAADDSGVYKYIVLKNEEQLAEIYANANDKPYSYTVGDLAEGTNYNFKIKAVDEAGNETVYSSDCKVKTKGKAVSSESEEN